MKVIFVGDSPTVSTGFSRCTRSACDALHAAGHKVVVLGINEAGDPRPPDIPYPIYPCRQPFDNGKDGFGNTRLPVFIARYHPDVVVLLNDPWNIENYFDYMDELLPKDYPKPPVVGWLAVDSENHYGQPLNRLAHVITWTKFGERVLRDGGYLGPVTTIPLGVDTTLFYPRDKAACKRSYVGRLSNVDDSFIVGVVGRNQPRKRLDLTLEYFAQWIHDYKIGNAYLFLHVAPTGDVGCNIESLIRYYNLTGRVMCSRPDIGVGAPDSEIAELYNAFDVYLTTSQAEGWGLPVAEAMACGIPCIVPDFASFSSTEGWVGGANENVAHVACPTHSLTAPWGTKMYTVGANPDRQKTIWALHNLYHDRVRRLELGEAGRRHISDPCFQWGSVGSSVTSVLEHVVKTAQADPTRGSLVDTAPQPVVP